VKKRDEEARRKKKDKQSGRSKKDKRVEEEYDETDDYPYESSSESEGLEGIEENDDSYDEEDNDDDVFDEEGDESGSSPEGRGRKERLSSRYSDAVAGRGRPTPSMHDAYARAATIPPTPLTPSLQRLKGFAQRRRTSIVYPTVQRQRRPLRRKTSTRSAVPSHLKQSMLKSIARSVTDMPFRVEALGVLAHQCQELMDSYVSALEIVAEQNHRHTIELPDVELLLHETDLIGPRQSLTDAMRKELPEELVERMIPIARARNVITPKQPTHATSSASSSSSRRK